MGEQRWKKSAVEIILIQACTRQREQENEKRKAKKVSKDKSLFDPCHTILLSISSAKK